MPLTNSLGDTIIFNDSSSTPTVSPLETTTFFVSIFDTNGCSIIDSTIINIKPLPIFDLGQDLSYCLYDSIELSSPTDQNYTATCGHLIIQYQILQIIILQYFLKLTLFTL